MNLYEARMLDRMLRRQHQEGILQRIGLARYSDLLLLIASSSADCAFGGARLISSARMMCAKMGPLWTRN